MGPPHPARELLHEAAHVGRRARLLVVQPEALGLEAPRGLGRVERRHALLEPRACLLAPAARHARCLEERHACMHAWAGTGHGPRPALLPALRGAHVTDTKQALECTDAMPRTSSCMQEEHTWHTACMLEHDPCTSPRVGHALLHPHTHSITSIHHPAVVRSALHACMWTSWSAATSLPYCDS